MKIKPLIPPKVEPIITKEIIMQIAFAVKELIQPDIDEIKVRLDKVEQRLDALEKRVDKIEQRLDKIETDIRMLTSFHIEDIKNYKATN